jgi:death-on-curing protein
MIPPEYEAILSVQRSVDLHAIALGQTMPELNAGCVERSLGAAAYADMYGAEEGAVLGLAYAGASLFYLATNHCFGDGNKRIAWLSAVDALDALGLTLDVSDLEAEAFIMRIADTQCSAPITDAETVIRWIAEHVIAL